MKYIDLYNLRSLIAKNIDIDTALEHMSFDAYIFDELISSALRHNNIKAFEFLLKRYSSDNIQNIKLPMSLLSLEHLDIALRYVNPNLLLQICVRSRTSDDISVEQKYHLVDFLISNGANISTLSKSYEIIPTEADFLLSRGIDHNVMLHALLEGMVIMNFHDGKVLYAHADNTVYQVLLQKVQYIFSISSQPEELMRPLLSYHNKGSLMSDDAIATSITRQKELISIALQHKCDLNAVFTKMFDHPFLLRQIHQDIAILLLENGLLPNTLLKFACMYIPDYVSAKQSALVNLALSKGADPNYVNEDGETVLETALQESHLDIVKQLIAAGAKTNVLLSTYMSFLGDHLTNIYDMMEICKLFPNSFSQEAITTHLRANGATYMQINMIFDIFNLAKDVSDITKNVASQFTESELMILDKNNTLNTVESFGNLEHTNKYGFTPLHLALLSGKFDLAIDMIKHNFNVTATTHNGFSVLFLYACIADDGIPKDHITKLGEEILSRIDNVDIILPSGESVVDGLLRANNVKDAVLALSQDPLFVLFKPNASLVLSNDKVHIGVSHGEGFWSTGVNTAARLITHHHSNVEFHLVTKKMIEEGGDSFLDQFSAWINPGGGDSYPSGMLEFSKSEWSPDISIEHMYQLMLEKTSQLYIPYLGICAGAQHFVLHHNGYLHPLKGYAGGQHTIIYKPGTLAHYQAMTKTQQLYALKTCEFPDIKFQGDTAHHFAAVPGKLGNNIQLGAISEDGISMSYAHTNGIAFATQFHPEHHYQSEHYIVNNQKAWLDNFVSLAQMHYNASKGHGVYPHEFMADVKAVIDKCMIDQICVAPDTLEAVFDL
ncbi:hypothetical protein EDM53_04485 [Rickettsiales endosymbiont of Peranema trichophorum]|uniref:glutamine amidotransferase-related protein n=1 Tax=Rickettsiales endosymbiont of Peranema trichophorum TaxID=2486577 RepID=UPI001022CB29|nr:gamma-glutamyl-gamma-aminobutyrate hydrolase family protein [Rickettsiales endosymbiont of Peranema trichophorum]RZI45986.1 hypothetical protein EDM53_04485 [Rickettsiales endosymbiont of Peranema trichophorum]